MTETQTAPDGGFTPNERAYIRGELDLFFSTLPSVAEGFQLKTRAAARSAASRRFPPSPGGWWSAG
jgi:hypothetical protein